MSACFLIFAAANQRATEGEHLIGIDRPYFADPAAPSLAAADVESAESRALAEVRSFLQNNDVPGYLIEEMFRHASNDTYWLSARDEANLGYKSASFNKYLAQHCAWSASLEQEVYARKRPIEDLTQLMKCRDRVTQEAAKKVLLRRRSH